MEAVQKVTDIQKLMIECGHTQHLTRERSLTKYSEKYTELVQEGWEQQLFKFVFQTLSLQFSSKEWEYRFGAVQVAVKTLSQTQLKHDDEVFVEVRAMLFEKCGIMLIDPEFRVRNIIGDIMQKLIEIDGAQVYQKFRDHLFRNIQATFNRDPKGTDASSNQSK